MTCIFCGSRTHDYRSCTAGAVTRSIAATAFRKEYAGQAPNVFIGRAGYPRVRVGILGTEQYAHHDDPAFWAAQGTAITDIVRLRAGLINSFFTAPIKGDGGRFMSATREVSLARRPVDVEIGLAKAPAPRMTFTENAQPHGPNVELTQARVTENAPVDTRVQKATDATDLRAQEAIRSLIARGVDGYSLTRAFSLGNFGVATDRKLVPTRWSITAVDDITSKGHLAQIRTCNIGDCLAYFGGHLGNHYLILCFDAPWQYELFEQYLPTTRDRQPQAWTDHEPHEGRTDYAHETAGGYYAARLAITEHLLGKRKQAAVLAIRIITDEYTVPLGVWVCREAVRKALANPPVHLADRQLLREYAKELLKRRFGFDADSLMRQSHLIESLFGQKRLSDF